MVVARHKVALPSYLSRAWASSGELSRVLRMCAQITSDIGLVGLVFLMDPSGCDSDVFSFVLLLHFVPTCLSMAVISTMYDNVTFLLLSHLSQN